MEVFMEIQIFGEIELIDYIESGNKTLSHCISIRDDKRTMYELHDSIKKTFKILSLEFHDEEEACLLSSKEGFTFSPPLAMVSDIYKVINFVENAKKEENFTGIVVHCLRGVSRSGAIAFGILYYFLRDEELASDTLVSLRRQVMPHKQICQWFDEIYGSHLADLGNTIYRSRMKAVRSEVITTENAE